MDKDITRPIQDKLDNLSTDYAEIKHVNIIIAGKSGIGKSTLINAAFKDELANTGTGKSVTDDIKLIQKSGVPIRIFDTVGLELGGKQQKDAIKAIKKLSDSKQKTVDVDDDIHCMWYCVSAASDRIDDKEIEFIQKISAMNIPVILVLTKVYSKTEADKFEQRLKSINMAIRQIVQVLAVDTDDNESFGIDKLMEETSELIPETVKIAFDNAKKATMIDRKKKAHAIVTASVVANFKGNDESISDNKVVDIQKQMMHSITSVYELPQNESIEVIISKMTNAASNGIISKFSNMNFGQDKETTTNAKNVIPKSKGKVGKVKGLKSKLISSGLDLIGGDLVRNSVSATVTTTVGLAYIKLMELIINDKINIDSYNSEELDTFVGDFVSRNKE
ncbi:GTPase [Paucilactobacillus nenjiangensis]|uniref:GTPase n=1 Tax=Paucilactobacillus nenjiangensis TaxID=1296540 RepID=UPI0010F71FBE|nr:GTPase domain-containing protein [Paucilactobacillus nenjiangensis]